MLKNAKQSRQDVIRTLKNSSKETVSIRLSSECLRELRRELGDIKRSNSEMKKLTVSKYAAALIEQYASNLKTEK